jgi:hypothetical protein
LGPNSANASVSPGSAGSGSNSTTQAINGLLGAGLP